MLKHLAMAVLLLGLFACGGVDNQQTVAAPVDDSAEEPDNGGVNPPAEESNQEQPNEEPAANAAPTAGDIPDQKIGSRSLLGPFTLVLDDAETAASDLDVSAVSSNQSVIPNQAITITQAGNQWQASILQPASVGEFGAVGDTDITVTVSDGFKAATSTFKLSVLPRINQYVAMGTHNSYHEEGGLATLVADWNYSHDSLDKQLLDHRVRSFELDIHWNPAQYMQVYHVSGLDDVSMCDRFGADANPLATGCLEMIKAGLDANPIHYRRW